MTSSFNLSTIPSILVLLASAATAIAAGDQGGHGLANHPEVGAPGDPTAVTTTIEVTMNDNYFEPETITVPAGSTVRFVVTNTGGLLHEFNLGIAAMHGAMQDEMAMMMDHGMISDVSMHHDMTTMNHDQMGGMDMDEMMAMLDGHPNRVMVEPGATEELVWTFKEAIELEFACTIPGRYDSGMVGSIQVEG
ncbi:MAG: cupredoxin domain-containing protein [Geminicoccales bacterium]